MVILNMTFLKHPKVLSLKRLYHLKTFENIFTHPNKLNLYYLLFQKRLKVYERYIIK